MKRRIILLIVSILTIALFSAISGNASELKKEEINDKAALKNTEESVQVDIKSTAQLSEYKNKIDKKILEISDDERTELETTITFNKGLKISQIQEMTNNYDINFEFLEIRFMNGDERVTGFTRTDWGLEKTNELIQECAVENNYEFVGYISASTTIPSDKIVSLSKDSKVFACDVSEKRIITDEKTGNQEVVKGKFPDSLAWEIEDYLEPSATR